MTAITRDDLVAFRDQYYVPNETIMAFAGDVTPEEAFAAAEKALAMVGLPTDPKAEIAGLGAAGLKKLELAKALATEPTLLLADESLGGLDESEMDQAADMLRRIRSELGITIIWVEHIMGVLMKVIDRCLVLDHGELIAQGTPSEVAHDPRVVDAMLPYLREQWFNPSSIYVEAQRARQAIDEAREAVAHAIGARADVDPCGVAATGTAYTGLSYVLMQNVYSLPSDCRSIVSVLNPVTGRPMPDFQKADFDVSAGSRALVGDPASYCVYDDSAETSPPVLHQIEFYPPPLRSRGFVLDYLRAAIGFDLTQISVPVAAPDGQVGDEVM